MRGASAVARSAMKVVAVAAAMVGGGAVLGPEVVGDVLGELDLRCRYGARLGLRLRFCSGFGPGCGDGFE